MPLGDKRYRAAEECKIDEITAFYIRFRTLGGSLFTEMLDDIHISYDDKRQRPKAVVWPNRR